MSRLSPVQMVRAAKLVMVSMEGQLPKCGGVYIGYRYLEDLIALTLEAL